MEGVPNRKHDHSSRIRTLELVLIDIGKAVKEFAGENEYGVVNSWKEPYRKMKDVDVQKSILELHGWEAELSEEEVYTHLAKLCIDRLFYSHMAIVSQLRLMYNKQGRNEKKSEMVEIIVPTMTGLIRKMTFYFRELHKVPQTDKTVVMKRDKRGLCSTCNKTTKKLRFIQEELKKCIDTTLKEYEEQEVENQEDMRQLQPLELVRDEVKLCCTSIIARLTQVSKERTSLKSVFAEIKQMLDNSKHEHDLLQLQAEARGNVYQLAKQVQEQRKTKRQLEQDLEALSAENHELSTELKNQQEFIRSCGAEKRKLLESIRQMKKLCETSAQDRVKMEGDLKARQNGNRDLKLYMQELRIGFKVERDNATRSTASIYARLKKLKPMNRRMEKETREAHYLTESIKAAICEERLQEKARLQATLNAYKADLELLRTYPDLNGPICPPTENLNDLEKAMKMVLEANKRRLRTLGEQNGRLSDIIKEVDLSKPT